MIQTERLLLRRFRDNDAEALHRAFSDPEVMRYGSRPPFTDIEETRERIRSTIEAVEAGEADDFVIEYQGRPIGKAGLWRGNELGFLLVRDCWGQGFAGEAIAAIVQRAFAAGHAVVRADVDPRNEASLRVLQQSGFVVTATAENTWCIGGVWVDSVYLERAA